MTKWNLREKRDRLNEFEKAGKKEREKVMARGVKVEGRKRNEVEKFGTP